MLVSENILEQALAQVFDGLPVNVDMTFAEINAAWARLGLRKTDLHEAIQKMVENHCLVARNLSGSLGFALTEHGATRFNKHRHQRDHLHDWLKQRNKIVPTDPGLDVLGNSQDRSLA